MAHTAVAQNRGRAHPRRFVGPDSHPFSSVVSGAGRAPAPSIEGRTIARMKTTGMGLGLVAVLFLTGCVTSRQARTVKPSAFLGTSASLLEQGAASDDTLLVYRNERADWRVFDK